MKKQKSTKNSGSEHSAEKLFTEILQQIQVLHELCPKDKTLSVKDRNHLARPAKERWNFVEAAMSFAKENPSLLPSDVESEKVEELMSVFHLLMNIDQSFAMVRQLLGENQIGVGNELLSLANVIYKMAQIQEKRKVPNASAVVSALKKLRVSKKKASASKDIAMQRFYDGQ